MTAARSKRCPCCGHPVEAVKADMMPRLGVQQEALLNILRKTSGRLSRTALMERLYANAVTRPKNNIISVMVSQMNLKTIPHGFKIECGAGKRDGYKLVLV
jgi:hypothetical protein